MPIVCEPKLGHNQSNVGIEALHEFPIETWAKYDLKVCIDIGDYLLATGGQPMAYLKKWQLFIKVVHLHNVEFHGDKYIWVPVHPSQVNNSYYYEIKDLIIQLAKSSEVYFVFEHTPHVKPTEKHVNEGIEWVKNLFTRHLIKTLLFQIFESERFKALPFKKPFIRDVIPFFFKKK